MAWRTTCLFALLLLSALPSLGDSTLSGEVTAAEYGSQLDHLIAETGQPDLPSTQTVGLLRNLPPVWRLHIEQQKFEIPTQWLREDLLNYGDHADPELLKTDHLKLLSLRTDLDGYLKAPADNSQSRARLADILARREFHDIHGPTWLDRVKQRLFLYLISLLSHVFRSSSIPVIGRFFVYGLVGLALLGLGYWIYRSIRSDTAVERIVPATLAVSAKEWAVWMAEARDAANQGNWREAIHLAYWAGISFLEAQGTWRPDRARTPREYLRLMPQSSERHSTLTALTRSFEVVWYGNREADSQAFSQTLLELEKLGCRPS